jgi:uncharacterized RDD family membrane protein YckC
MASRKPPERRPAAWGTRVGATLLDGLIVWGIVLVAMFVAAILMLMSGGRLDGPLPALLAIVSAGAYYVGSMTRSGEHNGQTLGKQAAGIRVERADGKPLGTGDVLLREGLLKGVLGYGTFGIGFLIDSLWPLGDKESRALHDLPVKTHVVDLTPAPPPPRPLPWPPPRPQLQMAPRIARHVHMARAIETRIHQLPFPDVQHEVSQLIGSLYASAERAQMLHDALDETPVASIEHRLAELQGSGKLDLIHALEEQLIVQRRMAAQFERLDEELERVVVELDTVRGSLLTVSASTAYGSQELLAERVRSLRDEVAAVAEGVDEAYG